MRTLSALFDSRSDATDAIFALQASGIPASQISLISWEGEEEGWPNSPVAVGAFCGVGIGVLLLVGNVTILVPLVASSPGWLATTLISAIVGATAGMLCLPTPYDKSKDVGKERVSLVIVSVEDALLDTATSILKEGRKGRTKNTVASKIAVREIRSRRSLLSDAFDDR